MVICLIDYLNIANLKCLIWLIIILMTYFVGNGLIQVNFMLHIHSMFCIQHYFPVTFLLKWVIRSLLILVHNVLDSSFWLALIYNGGEWAFLCKMAHFSK